MSDRLPTKGRRTAPRPAPRKPVSAPSAPAPADHFSWFAVALPGLEDVLADELRALTSGEAHVVPGGVELDGPLATGYLLDLGSHLATRVLVRLGEVQTRELPQLRRRMAALPFERCLNPELPIHVSVTTHRCRLFHTGAIAENLVLGASDRMRSKLTLQRGVTSEASGGEMDAAPQPDGSASDQLEPFTRVLVRGQDDRFMVSVDSSGPLLHKRGYRVEAGRAPLRETLAAGILRLAGYDGREPLVNAMCGAGTIALEAASIALQRAPGLGRHFALERFPAFDAQAAAAVRAAAEARALHALPAPIFGFDRDRNSIARARRNAERAQLASMVLFEQAEVASFEPPSAPGLVIANPPYGQRLGDRAGARAVWRTFADALHTRYRGYRVALLLPRDAQVRELRLSVRATYALRNGGLPVTLVVGQV